MTEKYYKINSRNSTVCGYPGRDFDWSLFDWEGKEIYRGHIEVGKRTAPTPWIGEGNEYLHVPYNWANQMTIYRVRPNEAMRAGKLYRGQLVESVKAVKKADGWYWCLDYEVPT